MSTASSIPAALDALIAAAERAAAAAEARTGEPVQVVDAGSTVDKRTKLVIGYAAGGVGDAVEDTQTISSLVLGRDMESYAVACEASTWRGNNTAGTWSQLRSIVFGVVDALVDELAADKTLGRAVISARVAEVGYVPSIADRGPTVTVPFRVQVDARRSIR